MLNQSASSTWDPKQMSHTIGWLLSVLIPLGIFYFSESSELSLHSRYFASVIAIAVCMWVFNLVPIFVPALLVVLVSILLDIAPASVVLAGYTSNVFFMCLGIFILAALVFSSGLMYRVTLMLLRLLPVSKLSNNLILFISGSLLTIFIPSPMGRSAMLTPLIFELIQKDSDSDQGDINITPLLISGLQGTTLLSTIFLTGNPLNFIMLGFFDAQTQYRFQWVNWFQATALVGVILTVGYLAIIYWQVRKTDLKPLERNQIDGLLSKLGPMSPKEWGGVLAIAFLCIGVLTSRFHRIEFVWLTFGLALVLYLYGALSSEDLRTHINWPILLFMASIVTWGPIMEYLGLSQLLMVELARVGVYFQQSLALGIGVLAVVILLIRLLFPGGPIFVIMMSTMIPLSASTGISPWVLGFVVLTLSEGFILPHQHGVYSHIMGEVSSRGLDTAFRPKDLVISNTLLLLLRLLAIYLTLPYWQQIAII